MTSLREIRKTLLDKWAIHEVAPSPRLHLTAPYRRAKLSLPASLASVFRRLHNQKATRKLKAVDILSIMNVAAQGKLPFTVKRLRESTTPLFRAAHKFCRIVRQWHTQSDFAVVGAILDAATAFTIKKRFENAGWIMVEVKFREELVSQLLHQLFIFFQNSSMPTFCCDTVNLSRTLKFGCNP